MNIENIDKLGPLKKALLDIRMMLAQLDNTDIKYISLQTGMDQQVSIGSSEHSELLEELRKDIVHNFKLKESSVIKQIEAL